MSNSSADTIIRSEEQRQGEERVCEAIVGGRFSEDDVLDLLLSEFTTCTFAFRFQNDDLGTMRLAEDNS
jgi:hypothetical protein